MMDLTPLSSNAIEIIVDGDVTPTDVSRIFQKIDGILDSSDRLDIYAEVRGAVEIEFSALLEEMRHFSTMIRLIKSLGRVAIVADQAWVRNTAKLEGLLIPGAHYEVYSLAEASQAREWLLRRTDMAHAA